jgi:integrase
VTLSGRETPRYVRASGQFSPTEGILHNSSRIEAQRSRTQRRPDNYSAALLLLERRAKGDYEPDELPRSFPAFSTQGTKPDGLTPWELFEAWVKSKQPAQSTVESWRTVFNALRRDFPDRSASAIKPEEAQQWLDKLITAERTAFTVHNTWLRATRTVFAWGARRKLTSNPFGEAVVDVPRRKQLRPKWLYEHERKTILRAAAEIAKIDSPDDAARHWVPWLLAYTGARPQDITQLRGKDVQEVDGIWTINITPEAETVKSAQARRVPLHEHLIERGFLNFVKLSGEGPLFYRPRRSQPDNTEPTKQSKSPAAQVRQRLAAWVREIGVDDEHISPNHAWRHTFKLIGRRIEQEDTLLDYICGHAPATVGRGYGEPTLKDLAQVIQKVSEIRYLKATHVPQRPPNAEGAAGAAGGDNSTSGYMSGTARKMLHTWDHRQHQGLSFVPPFLHRRTAFGGCGW